MLNLTRFQILALWRPTQTYSSGCTSERGPIESSNSLCALLPKSITSNERCTVAIKNQEFGFESPTIKSLRMTKLSKITISSVSMKPSIWPRYCGDQIHLVPGSCGYDDRSFTSWGPGSARVIVGADHRIFTEEHICFLFTCTFLNDRKIPAVPFNNQKFILLKTLALRPLNSTAESFKQIADRDFAKAEVKFSSD